MLAHAKEFEKLIGELRPRHRLAQLFRDFCEMSALAIANSVTFDTVRDEREKRYLDIVGRYTKEEVDVFPRLLAITVDALEDEPHDFLGQVFMCLELGDDWRGQFFTPQAVSDVCAQMTVGDDTKELIANRGFITVCEPAAGAGGMVIGMFKAMRAMGLNPQRHMHVTAIDIDATAAHMCFIQLSLLGIPAAVHIGDTLRMEVRETFYTPMHVTGFWSARLRRHDADDREPTNITPLPVMTTNGPAVQLELFA